MGLGPSISSVIAKSPSYSGPSYPSSPVYIYIYIYTGELGYDGPPYDRFLHMTDNMLGPSPMHIKYSSYVYTTDFSYDGPIFLVPLSLPYPSSPVYIYHMLALYSHCCGYVVKII